MGKQEPKKFKSKGLSLDTTQSTNAYRQMLKREKYTLMTKTKADMAKQQSNLNSKNNYLSWYRIDGKDNSDAIKYMHPLDCLGVVQHDFNQKMHRDKLFNKKNIQQPKKIYKIPLTSAHTYGWRQPYDFPSEYAIKSQLQYIPPFKKEKVEKK